MENVTDAVSNPFGMRPPCPHRCGGDAARRAVFGYGDANADFHVIGEHSNAHGGASTGVPFTDHPAGERVLDVLEAVGLLAGREGNQLRYENAFTSYRYLCCLPTSTEPTPAEYAAFEPFFDAELRAIAADVLVPVGTGAIQHVIETYTARAHRYRGDFGTLHATEIRGRGFLVVPIRNPLDWGPTDDETIVSTLTAVLESDYRQRVDLGRFLTGDDPYFVR